MALGETMQRGKSEEANRSEDVLVQARVTCEDFALSEALSQLPEAVVSSGAIAGAGAGVLPLLWIHAPDHDRVERTLRDDPTTTDVTRLTAHGEECLYRLSWGPTVGFVVKLLTSRQATILDVSANHDGWRLRTLYSSHRVLSDAVECCTRHDIDVDVLSIQPMTGDSSGQYGLTEPQYQSLKLAHERGYFEIPRDTDLGELAELQGISHQALSERLRRGTEKLMSQALFCSNKGAQNRL
ncbi:helix-turn-helix domain-containing protein [Halomarina salina]|uniref:Helix-turn-helix domain-containing protein n=1 Tax=Halomarina salina TaxID=1872699 RepID=A0ABD5RKE0_9EURY|nr:helix-turn-helix domain-containing protein [Halomarina salina]